LNLGEKNSSTFKDFRGCVETLILAFQRMLNLHILYLILSTGKYIFFIWQLPVNLIIEQLLYWKVLLTNYYASLLYVQISKTENTDI